MSSWTDQARRSALAAGQRSLALSTSRTGRAFGLFAGAVLFVVLGVRLGLRVRAGALDGFSAHPAALIAGVAATIAGNLALGLSWRFTLGALGVETSPLRASAALLAAQVGKYIPGGVAQVVSRVAVSTRVGVPAGMATRGLLLEAGLLVSGAGLCALLWLLPWTLWVGVVGAGLLGAALLLHSRRRSAVLALACHVGVFVGYGTGALALAHGAGYTAGGGWTHLSGAYAIAWIAGFLVLIAPGGLGVREAVFVALLAPSLGSTQALSLAVGLRVVSLLVDLLTGLLGAMVLQRTARGSGTTPHSPQATLAE